MKFLDHVKFDNIPLGLNGNVENPFLKGLAPLVHYDFIPTFGIGRNASDALSVLSDAQYVFVRHFNSGSRNYAAADLFEYELAVISVYLFYGFCKKVIGCTGLFDKYNRVLGKAIAETNHINLSDIRRNRLDAIKWLNLFREKLSTYVIPGDIAILSRWFSLLSCIIADDYTEGQTKQLYEFSPAYYYYYDWENAQLVMDKPGEYIYDEYGDSEWTLESMQGYANHLLSALQHSDDVGTISGDLLKAYKDNYYTLGEVEESYSVPIIRATNELLAFVNNATLIENPAGSDFSSSPEGDWETWTYRQTDGIITFNPNATIARIKGYAAVAKPYTNVLTNTAFPQSQIYTHVGNTLNALYNSERFIDFLSDTPTDEEKAAALCGQVVFESVNGKLDHQITPCSATLGSADLPKINPINSDVRAFIKRCGSEILCYPTIVCVDNSNEIELIDASQFMNVFQFNVISHLNASGGSTGSVALNIQAPVEIQQAIDYRLSRASYYNSFNCSNRYFIASELIVEEGGSQGTTFHTATMPYFGPLHQRGILKYSVNNTKFVPIATLNVALEEYCWENLVNDLWLKH